MFPAPNFLRWHRLGLAFFVGCTFASAADRPSAERAMALAREGAKAAEAGDKPGYLAKMEAAVDLRPDYPRILVNLAAAQVANDRPDEALATLGRLAALGTHSPIDKSPDFEPLRARPEFQALVKKFAANLYPKGEGELEFSLPDMTGVIEGIAWREKTGAFYFGDPHHRCVWVRTPAKEKRGEATVKRFTPEGEGLLGVLGLVVDEDRGTLWAATAAVPAMKGFEPPMDGTAALAEIDLDTGEIRRVIPLVRRPGDQWSHVLGDLALGPDGSLYLPDSGGPDIWRLAPGGTELQAWVGSPEFLSLQGAVVVPTAGALLVADHASGLLRVDLDTRKITRVDVPPDTTLIGIDGLVRAPNGHVLAIQNGLRPSRVLRLVFDDTAESVTAATVIESAHLTMPAPALGCIGPGGDLYFIANSGWVRFDEAGAPDTPPRPVPIFRTKLTVPAPKKK
jgi:hypothetical protein